MVKFLEAEEKLKYTLRSSCKMGVTVAVADALVQDGQGLSAVVEQVVHVWLMVRAPIVAPLLQLAVNVCLVMIAMLFVERMFMCGVLIVMRLLGRSSPHKTYKWEPMNDNDDDMELGNSSSYPMVLVQIPMYNEREVYQLSIQAACALSWPADRIVIQVLDDSTDPFIKVSLAISTCSCSTTQLVLICCRPPICIPNFSFMGPGVEKTINNCTWM